jgi:hypothetical protein
MLANARVDGVWRTFGEVFEVRNPYLIEGLLNSGCAVPADVQEVQRWRDSLPGPGNWATGWRR